MCIRDRHGNEANLKLYIVKKDQFTLMAREVSLGTLPNVNIRDPSHDKNLSIMSVTGSIKQNVFKN